MGIALAVTQKVEIEEAKVKKAVERGIATLGRVRRIVDGLLEFARSGAHPTLDFEVDAGAVLKDVAEGVRADAEGRNIEIRVDPFPPCKVRCSAGVLTSLVSNLVRNAVKYLGDSTIRRIVLSVSDRGDRWRVTVRDTGPGIPEGKRSALFEPYVRGHSDEPGIGLGLATVKRLAEAHGGTAGVDSRLGEGAAFWFEIPKAATRPRASELRS